MYINDSITLEEWELTESFHRASGPGGQHVNKTSSAVELRFEAERSPNLTGAVKARLKRLAGRRWTKDGAVIVTSESHRSQQMNRDDAREKLAELVRKATEVPKRRIKTRPTLGSKRRRLEGKKQRGAVKKLRGKVEE
ncbi:alternative ribosome rescue aminoacyl-tRNA hydrolase ArfB [Neptunicoccus sediminis]|uniref:alternative ribosome rescue aminoacyl-tRNA hydrolase ArfB n=1 Tax=Neptunicoccus sediminis TaxID=1892596 RepID=UPI0008461D9D|nr:alternative ribosome rescue aminoacyl-tRNA hydrolase ArfB [Neptunicoccus sediminis]